MKKIILIFFCLTLVAFKSLCRETIEFPLSGGKDISTNAPIRGDWRFRLSITDADSVSGPMLLGFFYNFDNKKPDAGKAIMNDDWQMFDIASSKTYGSAKAKSELFMASNTPKGMRAFAFNDIFDADSNFVALRIALYDFDTDRELFTFVAPRNPRYPAFEGNLLGYVRQLLAKARDMKLMRDAERKP